MSPELLPRITVAHLRGQRVSITGLCLLLGSLAASGCTSDTAKADNPEPSREPAAEPPAAAPSATLKAASASKGKDVGLCTDLCLKTEPLGCKAQAGCVTSCGEMRTVASRCVPAMDAFMDCARAQDRSSFECSEEGLPSLKEGTCDSEQNQVAACLVSVEAVP